jgi:catechol 2,3-dioxygenase
MAAIHEVAGRSRGRPDDDGRRQLMSVPTEIGHLVLNVTDVERSTRFYRDVVGFQVSRYRPDGSGAFLTCGVIHHNLALFKAPAGARPREKGQIGLNHFAFKVESYQALQEAHRRLVDAGAPIDHVTDHGMTRSVYFLDPDGIMMELFADAFATEEEGLAYMRAPGRPAAVPMDITAPEPARPEIPEAGYAKAGR